MNIIINLSKKVFDFYVSGFKNMKVGKKLWLIIGIKLFIFMFIFKILFSQNLLKEKFDNDEDRANFIIDNLTKQE